MSVVHGKAYSINFFPLLSRSVHQMTMLVGEIMEDERILYL